MTARRSLTHDTRRTNEDGVCSSLDCDVEDGEPGTRCGAEMRGEREAVYITRSTT